MREFLRMLLYRPLIADPGLSFLVISFDRVLLAVLALHMVYRLTQSAAVLLPPPFVPGNIFYWLRWWWLLLNREHRSFKLGGFLIALMFVLSVFAGQAGDLSTINVYFLVLHIGLGLILFGILRWARLQRLVRIPFSHIEETT